MESIPSIYGKFWDGLLLFYYSIIASYFLVLRGKDILKTLLTRNDSRRVLRYVLALVLWLTSLFFAGFVYSGWVLSNSLGANFHFDRHALACAMMLLCQSSGAALLCALRWKKANGVLLDLGDWTNLEKIPTKA